MSTTLAPPELCITTVRTLAIDAIEAAKSGHPGAPMGLAPVGWQLYSTVLRHAPDDPEWPDRDRFVLSAGHASMLLYALLHLTGYDLPLDEIKRFRQWDSITPGHPEHGLTPGVETTTGPLGQGFGNAVGFALAEELLAARFNRPGHTIVDHRTWCICSDGDLMEGISHEAASIAGHLRLGKLVAIYDSNRISLDGPTSLSFSEDVAGRFAAYGWRVLHVADGNDLAEIDATLAEAAAGDGRPTLVVCRTNIGFGSPNKQDSQASHGAALGPDEARATKEAYGWPPDAQFLIPPEVAAWSEHMRARGRDLTSDWAARMAAYRAEHPGLADEFARVMSGALPADWDADIPSFGDDETLATRAAGGRVLNAIAGRVPELVQGAADLSSSTDTTFKEMGTVAAGDFSGRNLYYGVREHAMGAITNGLTLHGGVRAVASTFLMFFDYMKNTIRLAALMEIPAVFVFTHDSIALGEDGPTHQPVEHLAALRAIPNVVTIRPADANETAAAWRVAMERTDGPTVLVLSRQGLPALPGDADVARGAYVVEDGTEATLIATGSEVGAAVRARALLAERGISARVVSMPSWELFDEQDPSYVEQVLPVGPPRISMEAAATLGWERWADAIIGIDIFGASAPGPELLERYSITAETMAEATATLLGLDGE